KSVLGADTGIVETRRNGIRLNNLSVVRLHQNGAASVQNAFLPQYRGGRRMTGMNTLASRLRCDESHSLVVQKMIKHSNRIAPATYASEYIIGQLSLFFHQLIFRFARDNRLKTSNHIRVWVRPYDRTNNVMSIYRIVDPVAQGFVGCIL